MSYFQLCKRCGGKKATLVDPLGNEWCTGCEPRYRLMVLGHARNFPDVQCPPYAIAEGPYFWFMVAIVGTDELIAAALNALEAHAA